jgi:H-type lectin domain
MHRIGGLTIVDCVDIENRLGRVFGRFQMKLLLITATLLMTWTTAIAQELRVTVLPAAFPPVKGGPLIHQGEFALSGPSLVPAGQCPTGPAGLRRQNKEVVFTPPFAKQPNVSVALHSLDVGDGRNTRVNAYAIGISRDKMIVVVETWCDTNLYLASGTYVAAGTGR